MNHMDSRGMSGLLGQMLGRIRQHPRRAVAFGARLVKAGRGAKLLARMEQQPDDLARDGLARHLGAAEQLALLGDLEVHLVVVVPDG